MARQLLLPKRLARALPWLSAVAQSFEAALLRGLVALLRALPPRAAFALARGTMRVLGPLTPMWDKVARNHAIAFPALDRAARRTLRRQTFGHLGEAIAELVLAHVRVVQHLLLERRVAAGVGQRRPQRAGEVVAAQLG